MITFEPSQNSSYSNCLIAMLRGYGNITPLSHANLSKGEKEFNKVIEHLVDKENDDYDPFINMLFTRKRAFIKYHKNRSSSLLYLTKPYNEKKALSIITIQNKREKLLTEFPFRLTLQMSMEQYAKSKKALNNLSSNEYSSIKLCEISYETNMYDLYFRSLAAFDAFFKEHIIDKVSPEDAFEFSETTNVVELKNAVRYILYGKNLKHITREWDNVYTLPGELCTGIADAVNKSAWGTLNIFSTSTVNMSKYDLAYLEKLKEVCAWCRTTLEKRFLLMGMYNEVWVFESEDDMNFFLMKWM